MTWQTETSAATASYRDVLTSIEAVASSQHVSATVINAGGTGFVVGDILTITHAGAYHDLRLEVTAVSGGVITATRIISGGAFSIRIATVAVNVGGTGYAVNDVLEIQGGTFTAKGKAQVTTVSAGVITGVALFESGGAYTVAPGLTGAATIGIGPAAFAGSDTATLNLTVTALIGTVGIAATGGTGTGATFDLTLTATGWLIERSVNNRTENSITDEKEVVARGTVAGGDAPYVAFFSYTQTDGGATNRGIAHFGLTAFNPAITALATQPGVGPVAGVLGSSTGSHTPVHEAAREWWLSVSPSKIAGVVRTTDITVAYASFYVGLKNRLGSATSNPYPLFIGASSNVPNRIPDHTDITGLSECFRSTASGTGPMYFRRKSDGVYRQVLNGRSSGGPVQEDDDVMWPVCQVLDNTDSGFTLGLVSAISLVNGVYGSNIRANTTERIFPAPDTGDDVSVLWPLTVLATGASASQSINLEIAGELDNVFWFPGTTSAGATVAPEDFMDDAVSGKRYRIFPNGTQGVAAKPYQFFMMAEE